MKVPTVVVNGHSFSVPAISKATSDNSTPSAAGAMLACAAKSVSVCASWLASSRQNTSAIRMPMPMPNIRQNTTRATANSGPRMLPV
ncbi:hypothetical protein FQZ97_1002380 [compost metagenome]